MFEHTHHLYIQHIWKGRLFQLVGSLVINIVVLEKTPHSNSASRPCHLWVECVLVASDSVELLPELVLAYNRQSVFEELLPSFCSRPWTSAFLREKMWSILWSVGLNDLMNLPIKVTIGYLHFTACEVSNLLSLSSLLAWSSANHKSWFPSSTSLNHCSLNWRMMWADYMRWKGKTSDFSEHVKSGKSVALTA